MDQVPVKPLATYAGITRQAERRAIVLAVEAVALIVAAVLLALLAPWQAQAAAVAVAVVSALLRHQAKLSILASRKE